MGCGEMEDIKNIKNVKNIQSLRISGIFYLLKKQTGFNVFDESKMEINERCLIEFVKTYKIPLALKERFQYYVRKNEKENVGYHEGVFYKCVKEFLKAEINENDFLLKVNDLLSEEKEYLNAINFQGFDFPNLKREKAPESFKKIKGHKKIKSHFILAPRPKNHIFKRKRRKIILENEKILKGESIKIPEKELCLKESELFGSNLMTGAIGSGLLKVGLSLFAQNLFKGNGGFYFSYGYNFEVEALYSVAQSLNREDDFLFINSSSFRSVFSFDFKDAIENNKIMVFTGTNKSNAQINMCSFADELMQFLFLKTQGVSLKEQGFMFMFNNVLNFFSLNESLFTILNKVLKERQLTSIFLESSKFLIENNILNFMEKNMENYFIFRQECGFDRFLSDELRKTAGELNPGEFLHFKSLKSKKKNKDFEKYLAYHHDDMKSKDIYETMF